jgi:diguanylate cyclase (GGDEF)-like protein
MNDPYVSLTSEIDVANSIVGQVIQSCNARVVERIATLGRPRFYPAERCESSGSLLVVPLNSISRCYGALVVESKDVSTYAENDVKLIRKLTGTASWALEILGLNDVAANFVATDEITGVASQKYFLMRLQEEVQRANDFLATVTVVLIGVDGVSDLTSRYGSDGVDAVMQSVGRVVKSAVRPYDVIGRYDTTTFGVILVQSSANEAALWSEKVRKNVASNIIIANEKTFSVTVSIGIANSNGTTRDVEILEHAGRVLNKAIESNGNIVRVY